MEKNPDKETLAATSIRINSSQKAHTSYYPLSSLHYLNSSNNKYIKHSPKGNVFPFRNNKILDAQLADQSPSHQQMWQKV